MQLDHLPPATQDLYLYASKCSELEPFTLIGGSALALQIGHRLSLDLDFAVFTETLPRTAIDRWVSRLRGEGIPAANITNPSAASTFRINTGKALDNYAQDFEIAGVKVTFFAHGRNSAQRNWYRQTDRIASPQRSFNVLGLAGLKAAKTLVLADRIRSRDLYDLMVLMRDHGLTVQQQADTVETLGHNNDFEHYCAAMVGELPLDAEDEGLHGPQVSETLATVYDFCGRRWMIGRWDRPQARRNQDRCLDLIVLGHANPPKNNTV